MSTPDAPNPTVAGDPLQQFSYCHDGILNHLRVMAELPELARAAAQARRVADHTVKFFHDVIYEHHAQEEKELFPAVLGSARPGDEQQQVQQIVDRLTREHREVEAEWVRHEPALRNLARGRAAELDGDALDALVRRYEAHASYEEREFLPLSETILGRDGRHMAALGLSLHMRHALPQVLARFRGRI